MKSVAIPVMPVAQKCTPQMCEETERGAVVDPGGDLDRIEAQISGHGVTLEKILLTRGHFDRRAGTRALAASYPVPIEGPQRKESFWIDELVTRARGFGFSSVGAFAPDRWLDDGDTVEIGKLTLDVRHCSVHL